MTIRSGSTFDSWGRAAMLVLAAVALGYAVQLEGDRAIFWLTMAFGACVLGVVLPTLPRVDSWSERAVLGVFGAGLVVQLGQLLTLPPGQLLFSTPAAYPAFAHRLAYGIALIAVIAGTGVASGPAWTRATVPLLLLTHFLLGGWFIRHASWGQIDVHYFQRDAIRALLHGTNPYTITFPNIYAGWDFAFYGPGLVVGDRLLFGFPYPPLSLFLALPGQAIGGDFRYAQLVALTLSGAFIAYARPGHVGTAAALLFLSTPSVFHVLGSGWTEPFAVLLLSATVFCACRAPRLLPVALGLFIAVKQHLVFAAPLALLLAPQPVRRRDLWQLLWQTGAVALAVSLPLMLWDVPAFFRSVVTLQFRQPFRPDALSYQAWFARHADQQLPTLLGFAALIPAVSLVLWRGARTPAGFAAGVALVYLAFFAVNKQAFANYYFFVIGALCCAVAATPPAAWDARQAGYPLPERLSLPGQPAPERPPEPL